jgi:adenine-specific DNA methylase
MRVGAAKTDVGRAFGFVKINLLRTDQEVTKETFTFQLDKVKLKEAEPLCANMTETSCMTAISEQGGKENQHGNDERFCSVRYRCDGRS